MFRSRFRTTRVRACFLAAIGFSAACVFGVADATAQSTATLATLTGSVVDESGGAVVDAAVTAMSMATMLDRRTSTGSEGQFAISQLPIGQYVVRVQRAGFAPVEVPDVQVTTDAPIALRIELKVDALNEAVVVTAQKLEERLRDVPVPVTALDAQRLTTDGHLGLREYFSAVPGLSMSTDHQGRQELAIRGVTTGRVSIPTVGLMVDDVPYGFSLAGFGSMPDVDPGDLTRIEVLRGPQGSLYGTSSMGGLIKYVTADPVFGRYSGRVEIGTSNVYNGSRLGYNFRASANLGLSQAFAVRVSGFSREEPGYIDNTADGAQGANRVDVRGGSVKALWRLPAGSITFGALYQKTHGRGLPEVDRLPGLSELEQRVLPGVGPYDRTVAAYSATVRAKIGRADLTSITGYNVNSFSDSWDGITAWGVLGQSVFGVSGTPTLDDIRYRKLAQEARLSIPLGRRVDAMVGGYFTHERSLQTQFIGAANSTTGALVGTLATIPGDIETKYGEESAFANLTYRVTDRFDVQVGGRESHYNVFNGAYTAFGPLEGPSGVFVQDPTESSDNVLTYLLTPRFKVSPDLMLYSRFASGYRPGGPNNAFVAAIQPTFKSDTTRNYEVGVKGEFVDHRVSVDASLFYIDWQNLQVQVNAPIGGYKTNGSGAKSEGVELSAAVRPVRGLSIDGWITYTDAVLTDPFPVGSPLIGRPGDRLPYSSRVAGNLAVQQSFPLVERTTGFVGASASYVGDRLANFRGTPPPARQQFPAYTRVDLRTGVNHDAWAVNLFVNNVADVRGIINISHYILYRYTYIQPRTVGLSLTKSF